MGGILAIGDAKNAGKCYGGAGYWAVGVLVMAIGMAFGGTTGYAINPARDFGPRCFTAIMLGPAVFTDTENPAFGNDVYWPIPLFATVLGGLLGSFVYTIMIEIHHDYNDDSSSCVDDDDNKNTNGDSDCSSINGDIKNKNPVPKQVHNEYQNEPQIVVE